MLTLRDIARGTQSGLACELIDIGLQLLHRRTANEAKHVKTSLAVQKRILSSEWRSSFHVSRSVLFISTSSSVGKLTISQPRPKLDAFTFDPTNRWHAVSIAARASSFRRRQREKAGNLDEKTRDEKSSTKLKRCRFIILSHATQDRTFLRDHRHIHNGFDIHHRSRPELCPPWRICQHGHVPYARILRRS